MKRNFKTVELGTTYKLPKYRVVDGKGIVELNSDNVLPASLSEQTITFVRGDKTDNGVVIPRVDGILHEQLLAMMIADLQYKNGMIPSKETDCAITKLQEALMWLEERQRDREARNVQGTYKN
jgi:hypothetical protein